MVRLKPSRISTGPDTHFIEKGNMSIGFDLASLWSVFLADWSTKPDNFNQIPALVRVKFCSSFTVTELGGISLSSSGKKALIDAGEYISFTFSLSLPSVCLCFSLQWTAWQEGHYNILGKEFSWFYLTELFQWVIHSWIKFLQVRFTFWFNLIAQLYLMM